ncbi:hypothetical protein H6P81_014696 [Aristolochia fimbriata]|uniref:Uncharacterized protein n=1 Tax=Aristolochia fimbriata TaxID=158543 RepID=A0AAV7E6B6_ARIFI|nr:hypothetical protein H6P81_014696 [Aristolochia fimbriata]
MDCLRGFLLFHAILCIAFWVSRSRAESLNTSTILPARALDLLLQKYAYGAFVHPRNEIQFDAQIPSNFTGVKLAAVRLRSGRLRTGGIKYREFKIPTGLVEQPHVKRLVLVYQNLGNWSSSYYDLPAGYHFLTPVLGLLAYDGDNLSATNLRELHINASHEPILIRFSGVKTATGRGHDQKCVRFGLNGVAEFTDMVSRHVCATSTHGHFSIVVNSTRKAPEERLPPSPPLPPIPPRGDGHFRSEDDQKANSRPWKFAWVLGGVLLGVAALVLAMTWAVRRLQKQRITEMEQEAETGEALRKATVGKSVLPMATGIRTQPVLENEYVP